MRTSFILLAVTVLMAVGCRGARRSKCDAAYTRLWGPPKGESSDVNDRARWVERCLDAPEDVTDCMVATAERAVAGEPSDTACNEKLKEFNRRQR